MFRLRCLNFFGGSLRSVPKSAEEFNFPCGGDTQIEVALIYIKARQRSRNTSSRAFKRLAEGCRLRVQRPRRLQSRTCLFGRRARLLHARYRCGKIEVLIEGTLNDASELTIAKSLPPSVERRGRRPIRSRWSRIMKRAYRRGRRSVSRSNRAPLDKGDKCKKYVKPWFYAPCHRVRCSVGAVTGGGLFHPSAHLDVGQHLNVAEKLLQYRFCREWIVIAERLA